VSGVPVSVVSNGDSPGITGIEFDPANTNIIFAASYGNGVYETTNAGASWSKLSGGPAVFRTRQFRAPGSITSSVTTNRSLELCQRRLERITLGISQHDRDQSLQSK